MIGIAVVGYGYWGPNLVRNFSLADERAVVAVCDHARSAGDGRASCYPAVNTYDDVDDMLADPAVDAVAIATPVSTHFELAMQALQAGKHVFVEKPLTATVERGRAADREADERGLVADGRPHVHLHRARCARSTS